VFGCRVTSPDAGSRPPLIKKGKRGFKKSFLKNRASQGEREGTGAHLGSSGRKEIRVDPRGLPRRNNRC